MKAIHKYKNNKHPEAQRRIAQSLGYRFSIYDMPHMIALLQRAGIDMMGDVPDPMMVDTDTLKL
jgi:hypothetical protein